jgi:hypothetical protein
VLQGPQRWATCLATMNRSGSDSWFKAARNQFITPPYFTVRRPLPKAGCMCTGFWHTVQFSRSGRAPSEFRHDQGRERLSEVTRARRHPSRSWWPFGRDAAGPCVAPATERNSTWSVSGVQLCEPTPRNCSAWCLSVCLAEARSAIVGHSVGFRQPNDHLGDSLSLAARSAACRPGGRGRAAR